MTVLLEIMFLMALAHFIYESILAPSWRLSLRLKLFALRDELFALKMECGKPLEDKHYACLRDSINAMASMLHRYDFATVAAAEFRYRRDLEFRKRIDLRAKMLDNCEIPEARSIRRRSVDVVVRAIAVNSGMLCVPLYALMLMGIGFSTLRKRLGKLAALSRRELERVAPERLGVAMS